MAAEGEFALVKEQLQTAFARSGQPVKRGSMAHQHDVLMALVEASARLANAPGLEEYVPQLEELAMRDNHKFYLAIARRARGVALRLSGDYDGARSKLQAALDEFSAHGMRWQVGRTRVELGELERDAGAAEQAREHFQRALEEFQTMGAVRDLARCRELLETIE
jgi:tetratricopeptide (TPR) repeat protein